MEIVIVLVAVYLSVYVFLVLKAKSDLKRTTKLTNIFGEKLIEIVLPSDPDDRLSYIDNFDKPENREIIHQLVIEMPKVKEIPRLRWGHNSLSLTKQNYENYENAIYLFQSMMDIEAQLKYDYKKSFNPLNAFFFILSTPSKIISFFGGNIKSITAKRLVNFFIWMLGLLIKLFSDEFKSFIVELIQKIGLI